MPWLIDSCCQQWLQMQIADVIVDDCMYGLCRRLQAMWSEGRQPDKAEVKASVQQEFEAEIASMALAVLVRLTAHAGQWHLMICCVCVSGLCRLVSVFCLDKKRLSPLLWKIA